MTFVNCTPHNITVESLIVQNVYHPEGENWHKSQTTFQPSGNVARVEVEEIQKTPFIFHLEDFYEERFEVSEQKFGEIIGLPKQKEGVVYIVSAIVLTAAKAVGRTDCVAPNTAQAKRNDQGHIISVPGFIS